jgi:uncharacterized protein involved in type VI secretion and phage assembly
MSAVAMATRIQGVIVGVVQDLDDPQKLGRVRVELPTLGGQLSAWARIATLMAGPDRGSLFRPEPLDEVLVAFNHGDVEQPFVIGALWNANDTPPENGGTSENHLRTLRSRSGSILRFDDTPGAEKVEIIASGEAHRVVIDVAGKKVSVEADEGDVIVNAGGNVKVEAGGNVEVKATGNVKLEGVEITVQASGVLTLKGAQVKIN